MKKLLIIGLSLAFGATSVQAAEIIVKPTDTSWKRTTGGTTAAAITATEDRNGNGSLELKGDASRFQLGGTNFLSPKITSFGGVNALTFDWRLAGDSAGGLNVDYTPALRLFIKSGLSVGELIWEGAYNGVYGDQTVPDTWYSTTADSKFYLRGQNENNGMTIADWASARSGWDVIGISVGHGSGAGSGYHAFADNVTLSTTSGSTTYNFETNAVTPAVPEPATWAMMILGMGAIGFAMRRRMKVSEVNFTNKVRAIAAA
ncbi:PEPxxWA-CTERM sorting domain-containing protein [Sphingomonas endolithica]|uniref:PEPxxWA-CTERM sorting domain-containing protein n=1 Tax=Sphingomonas endolithica TaxID=2972485 RepID=UPI0021B05B68|nr:PEPxxWA-CTERM sorting domain-containing protein [Sphingomonas sp. ZFBP2030]